MNNESEEIEIRAADITSIGLFVRMNSFNKPRSSVFSTSFIGRRFNDTRLDSATRVIERAKKREDEIKHRISQKEEWAEKRRDQAEKMKERKRRRQIAMERKLWEERQKLKALELQRRENIAAVRLQSVGKGFLCRQSVKEIKRKKREVRAATMIQSQTRRTFAVVHVQNIKKEAHHRKQHQSATSVQRIVRGCAARKHYERLKEARDQAAKLKEMSALLDTDLDLAIDEPVESPPKAATKVPATTKPRMKYTRVGGGYERRPVAEGEEDATAVQPKIRQKPRGLKTSRKEIFMTATQARSVLTGPQWSGSDRLHQMFDNSCQTPLITSRNHDNVDLPSPTRKLPGLNLFEKRCPESTKVAKRPKRPNTRPATLRPARKSPKKKRNIAARKKGARGFQMYTTAQSKKTTIKNVPSRAVTSDSTKANTDVDLYENDGFEPDDIPALPVVDQESDNTKETTSANENDDVLESDDGYGSDGFESDD